MYFFYTENKKFNCKEQHIIHLFILLGKFHIHKKKWAQCKPNVAHFMNDFKLYVNLLEQTKNKKALKTCQQSDFAAVGIELLFRLARGELPPPHTIDTLSSYFDIVKLL